MKSHHKLSKNCSMHCKNYEFSGPNNFWTFVKSNVSDVWKWNFWTLLGAGIEVGRTMTPPVATPLINTISWWRFLSYRNQSIDLFCKFVLQICFCIIGTLIMNDSRRSSSTYTESLVLHVAKYNLIFLLCFFLYGFSFTYIHIHRTAGWGGGCLLISFLPLPPASQTLKH